MNAAIEWRVEMLLDMAADRVRDMLRYPGIARDLEREAFGVWLSAFTIAMKDFEPAYHFGAWRDAILFPLVGTQFDRTDYAAERAA